MVLCKFELEANGPWPELEGVTERATNKVIPRLLEGLHTQDGEKIKPCIIHGDLWKGNMGIDRDTRQVLLFDAGSYFAHNEMELGQALRVRFRLPGEGLFRPLPTKIPCI